MDTHKTATERALLDVHDLTRRFNALRRRSEDLARPLSPEDQSAQSMPDCSPVKWHLAHTTWFFETFLLRPYLSGYVPWNAAFESLFNSYYETVGSPYPRERRGLITRPGSAEVASYRVHVTEAMNRLFDTLDEPGWTALAPLIELGISHEEQHQELMLMDILHLFSCNPLKPAYRPPEGEDHETPPEETPVLEWIGFDGGVHEIGFKDPGFAFDNEGPRHEVLLRPFRLASRPVINAEWMTFIEDGGYDRPELWLSDGWSTVRREGRKAPLYWERTADGWETMTLYGPKPPEPHAPVCHIGYYEADAFARWSGRRLPSEAEWEVAAGDAAPKGNTLGSGLLRPRPMQARPDPARPTRMFGDVWEWTASPYVPYPGYRPPAGAVGEYNGKFMCNQMVLRGGCCVTPDGHVRATYRNFFYPHQRWAFAGLRLADDA